MSDQTDNLDPAEQQQRDAELADLERNAQAEEQADTTRESSQDSHGAGGTAGGATDGAQGEGGESEAPPYETRLEVARMAVDWCADRLEANYPGVLHYPPDHRRKAAEYIALLSGRRWWLRLFGGADWLTRFLEQYWVEIQSALFFGSIAYNSIRAVRAAQDAPAQPEANGAGDEGEGRTYEAHSTEPGHYEYGSAEAPAEDG